jgi:hypothetical protein
VLTVAVALFAVLALRPGPSRSWRSASCATTTRSEPEFTRLRPLDTEVDLIRQAGQQPRRKARLLRAALILLLLAVAWIAGGVLLAELQEVL